MNPKAKENRRMHPKKFYSIFLYVCATSIFFVISGIALLCLWELIYNYIISSNLILKPNSSAYEIWIRNPIPISLKLFVFNWTNPESIRDNSTKAKFQQMGPYYFSETKEKSSVIWNDNDTVTYNNLRKWYFEPSLSNGSLSDTVTSLNPVAFSAAYTVRNWAYGIKKILSFFMQHMDSIASSHTVGQVLFEGYNDSLLQSAASMSFLHSSIPKMEKFAWFYGRNESEEFDGTFNIDTGVNGQIGQLYNWKYRNHTPYYPDSCGAFEDTSAGEFYPRKLRKSSIIKFFSPDLCRYVELEYEKEVIIHGIVGYKYSAGDKFLDNGTKLKENRCFCDGDCMPYGALNVSTCRYGSPAFVSLPHFHKADPYYLQDIEGLVPDEKKHDFYIIFEPETGIPLKVAARLQLNLRIQGISSMRLYEDLPTIYIPILWFEQVVTIPSDMAFKIKLLLNFRVMSWAISIISICIGILIQICLWYKICTINLFGRKKSKKQNLEISTSQENAPLQEKNENEVPS